MSRSNNSGKKSGESQILRDHEEWLAHRTFAWRNNTGEYVTPGGGYVRYGFPGSGDILGLTPYGRFFTVETKRPKGGRQGKRQQSFERCVTRHGGLYLLSNNIELLEPLDYRFRLCRTAIDEYYAEMLALLESSNS